MTSRSQIAIFLVILIIFLVPGINCWKKNAKQKLQLRETTPFNFIRLVAMRLIYGVASAMGFSESISNFLGGIFVPPGVENDYGDYEDYDL